MTTVRALTLLLLAAAAVAAEPVVAEDFADEAWPTDAYATAHVAATRVDEAPADAGGDRGALAIAASFPASFAWAACAPARPLVIPGAVRRVVVRWRGDGSPYPLILTFTDALGREQVDGSKLEWTVGGLEAREWTTSSFEPPAAWTRPLRIRSAVIHNWARQDVAGEARALIDSIAVETDLSPLDPATGAWKDWTGPADHLPAPQPLRGVDIVGGPDDDVVAGGTPAYRLRLRSWLPGRTLAQVRWSLLDRSDGVDGKAAGHGEAEVPVVGLARLPLRFPHLAFGLWRLTADVAFEAVAVQRQIDIAYVPEPHRLDDAGLDASPWGVDAHGGRAMPLEALARLGVAWFRDYAWNYAWMVRAKGGGAYDGWPWYPKLLARYRAANVRVLPVLAESIQPPAHGGPDDTWKREVADIVRHFPEVRCWELDNEYDGGWKPAAREEAAGGWRNFLAWHRAFGDVVRAAGGGAATAVAQGTAGIRLDLARQGMQAGDYAEVGVLNCHHYCGVDAPEQNLINQNTGGDDACMGFADRLRALVRTAVADGKPRPVWLTEFGWDTKAGKIVDERHQAAYLQRGFLVALAAGVERAFWYWDIDGEKADTFFGGCGLFHVDGRPKPAAVAMAGLTHALRAPRAVGPLDAGEGTAGFLFADGDRLMATLWMIEDGPGIEVDLGGGELADWRGNPLTGTRARLGLHPLFASGVPRGGRWARQAAWSLASDGFGEVAAGDDGALRVGVRPGAAGRIRLIAPAGWGSTTPVAVAASVHDAVVELPWRAPAACAPGDVALAAEVAVDDDSPRQLRARVRVIAPFAIALPTLGAAPGTTKLAATVTNRSRRPLAGELTAALPGGWSVAPATAPVAELAPGASASVPLAVTWTAAADRAALVTATARDGASGAAPLVPGTWTIPRIAKPDLDGSFAEWSAASILPAWMVAAGDARAAVRLAWCDDGLLVGVSVSDTSLLIDAPRDFWDADACELFVGAAPSARGFGAAGRDRHLWLVPKRDGGVFAGIWKHADEIPDTVFGAAVRGAAIVRDHAYALEALVPTALAPAFAPRAGAEVGLALSLAIHGRAGDRESAWPIGKASGVGGDPARWGRVVLGE